MKNADIKRLSDQIKEQMREAIAAMVKVGIELAESRELLGRNLFQGWCVDACRMPLADAELLIRYASARPMWKWAEAVDLDDPLAVELFEVALRHTGRQLPGGLA